MIDFIKNKVKLVNAKKNLSNGNYLILKAFLNNPEGLTMKELKNITGYSWNGWTRGEIKAQGYNVSNYGDTIFVY